VVLSFDYIISYFYISDIYCGMVLGYINEVRHGMI